MTMTGSLGGTPDTESKGEQFRTDRAIQYRELSNNMYITRALIGRNPCLDQAIQTRKFKVKVF